MYPTFLVRKVSEIRPHELSIKPEEGLEDVYQILGSLKRKLQDLVIDNKRMLAISSQRLGSLGIDIRDMIE
ncbi:uncharacterized protein DFL_002965 [Arthrobotrys flagrans]|uniref:Uncharacterized protein n=1 Tax=Arthrobotrys flagrans TaxID=97331 RepID=A0A437ACF3_ARTFL|nr:hypothetical protein DFL_002965 [Arthrobotrys flagrans]